MHASTKSNSCITTHTAVVLSSLTKSNRLDEMCGELQTNLENNASNGRNIRGIHTHPPPWIHFPKSPNKFTRLLTGENLSDMIVSCAVLCTNVKIHTPLRARYLFQLDKTSASS
jgi:hypothetical protein